MGKKEFDEFLSNNLTTNQQERMIDWEVMKEEWLEHIDTLYADVENWLRHYTEKGQIFITYRSIQLREGALGEYTARAMGIKIGNRLVNLVPHAMVVVGAQGRVDLIGSYSDTIRFVLVDEKTTGVKIQVRFVDEPTNNKEGNDEKPPKLVWKISTRLGPQIKYIKLDEGSFFDSLMQVSNEQK